jgi:hypothetical protein
MFLVLAGLILGFQKKKMLSKVGKSISCFAFVLTNWVVFYNTAYPHDTNRVGTIFIPFLTDVWRWLPALIMTGVLIICLLFIWKPFSNKNLLITMSGLAVSMIAAFMFAILTWENFGALNPQYWQTTAHINYNETFLQEFLRIAFWTKEIHLITSIMAIVTFLCFRKNPICSRIGKSLFCTLTLLSIGLTISYYLETWIWLVSAALIIILSICLFFFWKPFIFKKYIDKIK